MADYSHLSDAEKRALIAQKSATLLRRADRIEAEDITRQARADALEAEARANAERIEARERIARRQHQNFLAQERADSVFTKLGMRAPQAIIDEHPIDYRCKLAKLAQSNLPLDHELAPHRVNIDNVRDDDALRTFEGMIYPEVEKWALHPSSIPRGEMRMVEKIDPKSGQHMTEFFGQTSFINGMSRPGRKVRRIIAADSKTGVRTVLLGPREDTL